MILLDTDHLTLLKYADSERGVRLNERLLAQPPEEVVAVSIISVEEQMRGWLAAIARERHARRQVTAYGELARLFDFFGAFTILPFDERAADQFDNLRAAKIRLGAMDLKT